MKINEYGLLRVAAAIPELKVGDCDYNANKILDMLVNAEKEQVQIICFPELTTTGYTCGDLFFQEALHEFSTKALEDVLSYTIGKDICVIVGAPLKLQDQLFNCAIVIQNGKVIGVVPKTNLPNNNEFYEKRWFASAKDAKVGQTYSQGEEVPFGTNIIFSHGRANFAIEICEDVWVPIPPSSQHAVNGANIIFNLSATNELSGKNSYLHDLIKQQSARTNTAYIYASSGFGESSTDLVYAGNAIIAENGGIVAEGKRFSLEPQLVVYDIDIDKLTMDRVKNTNFTKEATGTYTKVNISLPSVEDKKFKRFINKYPFLPSDKNSGVNCEEIFSIQVHGLAKRWQHTNAEHVVLGISGGLDSTLALLVAVKTADLLGFDRKRVVGITMPGFGTTGRTYNNAVNLMSDLGVTSMDISIKEACMQHFADIGLDYTKQDVTYENTQARERTQILMDTANKMKGFVIGTGDLSELALGWATYNGDHMSMYGVNTGVPKTLVKYLIDYVSSTFDVKTETLLMDILDTPVSPELLPASETGEILQITEDVVGPYILHDFFLYNMIRFGFEPRKIFALAVQAFEGDYNKKTIMKWLTIFYSRFFAQQFKRSCMPDGPKVGSINLSPRGDWRMPSDAVVTPWLNQLKSININKL